MSSKCLFSPDNSDSGFVVFYINFQTNESEKLESTHLLLYIPAGSWGETHATQTALEKQMEN